MLDAMSLQAVVEKQTKRNQELMELCQLQKELASLQATLAEKQTRYMVLAASIGLIDEQEHTPRHRSTQEDLFACRHSILQWCNEKRSMNELIDKLGEEFEDATIKAQVRKLLDEEVLVKVGDCSRGPTVKYVRSR